MGNDLENGVETFIPDFSHLDEWSNAMSRELGISSRTYKSESMKFGGNESYGFPIYDLISKIVRYFRN